MAVHKASARADAAAQQRRSIQREQDSHDRAKSKGGGAKARQAVQAGAREHPTELPAQHLGKPASKRKCS